MKLKKDVDMNAFMKDAQRCNGSVFCQTTEGDILNLKSLLSQHVMLTVMGQPHSLEDLQITCVQEEDYQKLSEYLEDQD